ncbi:DUF4157 domain-containing protein [Moorena sp. SIO3A2]|uniref:eCIS core domain-containing protein n=1 Tax=Moorena sp. SIO3A2 TaxID=2607841 RepID=UPI00257C2BAE|nr:DUF4157 domain-containing protein [Moorena sp. SIO3A2]
MGNLRQSQTKKTLTRDQSLVSGSRKPTYHPIEELQGIIGNRALGNLIKSQPDKYGQVHRSQDPLLSSVSPVSGQPIQRMPMFRGLSHELRGNWQQGNPVQAKLTIGEAGDKYELEADRVASEDLDRINAPIPNKTGLPDKLKAGVENLSGYSLDDVRVHYNSPKPAQIQALAYTQGKTIEVGPGQERHLPHEAWHVVQQMQGRVQGTTQTKGIMVNDEKSLEQEADLMGRRAVRQAVTNPANYQNYPQHLLETSAPQTSLIQCMSPEDAEKKHKEYDHKYSSIISELIEIKYIIEFSFKENKTASAKYDRFIEEIQDAISNVRSIDAWEQLERDLKEQMPYVLSQGMDLVYILAKNEGYQLYDSGTLALALEKLHNLVKENVPLLPRNRERTEKQSSTRNTSSTKRLKQAVTRVPDHKGFTGLDVTQTGAGVGSGFIGALESGATGITGPLQVLGLPSVGFAFAGIGSLFGAIGTYVAIKNRKEEGKSQEKAKSLDERYKELKGESYTTAGYTERKAESKLARARNDIISGTGAFIGGAGGAIAAGVSVAGVGAASVTGIGAGVIGVIAGIGAIGLLLKRAGKKYSHRKPPEIAKTIIEYWEDPKQGKFAKYILKNQLGLPPDQAPNKADLVPAIEKNKGKIRNWAAKFIVEQSIRGNPLDRAYAYALIGALGVDPNIPEYDLLYEKVKASLK